MLTYADIWRDAVAAPVYIRASVRAGGGDVEGKPLGVAGGWGEEVCDPQYSLKTALKGLYTAFNSLKRRYASLNTALKQPEQNLN